MFTFCLDECSHFVCMIYYTGRSREMANQSWSRNTGFPRSCLVYWIISFTSLHTGRCITTNSVLMRIFARAS
jgi:hypothetical protein